MKAFTFRVVLLIAAIFIAATTLQAAPSLSITEPPVSSLWPDGPTIDPGSTNGQWFVDLDNIEEFRTHEFHDNTQNGAGNAGSRAIMGFVVPGSIVYDVSGTNIIGFKIKATISNDTDSAQGVALASTNSHGETRPETNEFYRGTLVDTKLTAEFAVADPTHLPTLFTGPYRRTAPLIIADDEDQKAWYCWNPVDPPPDSEAGNYYVPTWDFGDIPVGQSATRTLSFSVKPAMTSLDPRYSVIQSSAGQGLDVFANRTSSLKISTWIDDLGIDYPDPENMLRDSDVSVFHHTERDWGDAPDIAGGTLGFNTLSANSGANHTIVPGILMGKLIDAEPDGQPTLAADGDDLDSVYPQPPPTDDEDGVQFMSPLIPGVQAQFNVTVSVPGFLDVWLDVDNSSTWTAPDHIWSGDVVAGLNPILVVLPTGINAGQNYMRFRYNTIGPLPVTGGAANGEVEDYLVYIKDPVDWGDAPAPYPTLAINNGAHHFILGGGLNPTLGFVVDPEPDGQPTALADGDDTDVLYPSAGDDEDGVTFLTPLISRTVAQVDIVASGPPALLQGWIDFNGNGSWADPGEQIFTDVVLATGTNSLTFPVPAGLASVQTYARFRYSSTQGLKFIDSAPDGEVEDYRVSIESEQYVDWGDAPQPYPTLLINNGAHHVIQDGMFLGIRIDPELDGQPSLAADGDDNTSYDDEDGVFLTSLLMPGGYAGVDVIASQPGILDAWVDFEGNGTWAEASNRIFAGQPLTAGTNALIFPVPIAGPTGSAYARFRYTSGGVASYTGLALDGEVEDYLFQVEPIKEGIDWGDAPDSPYPTLNASGGASHTIVAGVMLGATIDPEPDGQPTTAADGDDIAAFDDEDGVTFTSKLVAGSNATVNVVAGVLGGKLDAWIDFNKDGDWYASEKIFTDLPVMPGLNSLSFPVPGLPAQALGPTYARFRISTAGTRLPTGHANDGEVEDYLVELYQPAPSVALVVTNLMFNAPFTMATIEWTVENGITYQMESSTNLVTGPWIPAGITVIGPLNSQTDSIATDSNKFYRVTAPWIP